MSAKVPMRERSTWELGWFLLHGGKKARPCRVTYMVGVSDCGIFRLHLIGLVTVWRWRRGFVVCDYGVYIVFSTVKAFLMMDVI